VEPTVATPRDDTLSAEIALSRDELGRVRVFLGLVFVFSPPFALAMLQLPAGGLPRWLPSASTMMLFVISAGYLLYLRGATGFSAGRQLLMAFLGFALGAMPCVYAVGVFSAAPMALVLALYFFALVGHARGTLALYLALALLHLVPASLFILGVVPDPGIVRASDMPVTAQLVLLALEQLLLFGTYLLGRRSRHVTEGVMRRLHDAIVGAERREALLAEARLDLDRALGPDRRGLYSGRVVGEWTLGGLIGRGAMGDVYEAMRSDAPEERAAVKLLHVDLLEDPTHLRRFFREAEIAATLDSAHVVKVLAIGATSASAMRRGEQPYIAMELLRGHDLGWHLRRTPRLALSETVELAVQVSRALEVAAAAGVVHRDLKPQNVFGVEERGAIVWKVLDFGVSKLTEGRGTLTQGDMVGTPAYMAPEQAGDGEVGPAADVFALAAIIYRALMGRPAFSGASTPKTLYEVCHRQPPQPRLFTDVPEDVERVLALGLAKDPRERFASARELACALSAAAGGELAAGLRARADDVVRRAPWGGWLGGD
jgi:serine/threonine-protein kinase